MVSVRHFVIALSLLIVSTAVAEECPLPYLADRNYDDLDCQFYLGTTAYRAGVYEVAAAHWQRIVDSPDDSAAAKEFRSTARSTIAYLKYNGLGVVRDRQGAVDGWIAAVSDGEIEARRQLGFAYADPGFEGYDPVMALAWYRSLLLAFPNPDALDDTDKAVYQQAGEGAAELEAGLTDTQIARARETAEGLLQ